eukprot:4187166-Amphidinium_carterae.1
MKSCQVEPRLYYLHAKDIRDKPVRERVMKQMQGSEHLPVLLLTTHVDDLKLTGPPELHKLLQAILSQHLGKLKIETDNFTH